MTHHQMDLVRDDREQWLKHYYFIRAAFSVAWVVAAFAAAPSSRGDRRRLARALSGMGRRGQFRRRLAQRRPHAKPHAGAERCGQPRDHHRGPSRVADEHELGARRLRRMGDPVRLAPAGNGDPALEKFWRAMGDGAQRRSVGARGRLLHLSSHDADVAIDRECRGLCRGRRDLLLGLGRMAHRQRLAPTRQARCSRDDAMLCAG